MAHNEEIIVTFAGGKRVNTEINGHVIATDQPKESGGDDSAPAPYSLFLAAMGTCAGIYVLGFLQARQLATDGVKLRQRLTFDPMTRVLAGVELIIDLPETIPEKYHAAIIRAADTCAVKKAIQQNPKFEVRVERV
jgi:putative redox protein